MKTTVDLNDDLLRRAKQCAAKEGVSLRVFDPPSPLATALDFLDRLQASPSLRLLLPGPDFPDLFRDACESARVRRHLAFDAQIAAVCREHGVHEMLTGDRDFARFDGLAPRYL